MYAQKTKSAEKSGLKFVGYICIVRKKGMLSKS